MANSILTPSQWVPVLDEVYKQSSLTADLDGAPELAKPGANANELIIPKLSMDGQAAYNRNSGYVGGDVTLQHETVVCGYDRGRMFSVDTLDNAETADIAFGRLSGEYQRTKVNPELDAYRFAAFAGHAGISKATGTLSTAADVISALRAGVTQQDEDEVSAEGRILYITPTLLGLVEDQDTTKSKEVLAGFEKIVKVPQTRFYTAIDLLDGTSTGQTGGGYRKHVATYKATEDTTVTAGKQYYSKSGDTYTAVTPSTQNPKTEGLYEMVTAAGTDINFMIIQKSAVIQYPRHIAPKIVTPETNQSADAWKFGYRMVSVADVYDNKVAGIYLHCKA